MKIAKNVDGKLKNQLSSMKTAENVDEKYKPQLPSTKTAENEDGSPNLWPHAAHWPHRSVHVCWFRAELNVVTGFRTRFLRKNTH